MSGQTSEQPVLAPTNSLENVRVLLVEDEYLLADDLANALKRAGADLLGPIASVEQAEEALMLNRVDAAVLDINLRGMTTIHLVERLTGAGLPCLIVSGYSEEALPAELRDVPRLEKPVDLKMVVARLAAEVAKRQ